MKLSKRGEQIQPSATLKAAAKAKELKDQGKEIISLILGEPDFTTPEKINLAAKAVIDNGKASFYTTSSGMPELKAAVVDYVEKYYQLSYQPNEVLISTGAKFALYSAFQALLDPEDEVLIPIPFWVSYSEQVKLAGGKPIFVTPKDQSTYKVTVADLKQQLTEKTKVLLLNSPSNPTGMIYTKEELAAIGEFAVQHHLYIIADDIYSRLIYNGATYTSIAMVSEAVRNQTIVITGVSKTYAMTGWRIGFAFGPKKVIDVMSKIQSHATSNPTTVSQYAALAAISGDQSATEKMRLAFENRLNQAYELVIKLPGFALQKPQGAFYLFPDVTEAMKNCGYQDVDEFTEALLYEAGVAVVSGTGFGLNNCIRLSYATSTEIFSKGIERILDFLTKKSLK